MKIQKRWSRGAVAFGAAAVALAAAGCSDGSGLNGPQGVGDTAMPVAAPAPANPLPLGGSDEAGDAAADDLSAELAAQQAEKARLEQTIAELGRQIEELKEARTEERGDDDERDTDRTIARLEDQLEKAKDDLREEQERFSVVAERVKRLKDENDALTEAEVESQSSDTSLFAESAPSTESEELLRDAFFTIKFLEIGDASETDEGGVETNGYPKKEADFLCVLFFSETTYNTNQQKIRTWEDSHHNQGDSCEDMGAKACQAPLELADGFTCIDLGPCDGDDHDDCDDKLNVSVMNDESVTVDAITHLAFLMNDEGGDDPQVFFMIDFKNGRQDVIAGPPPPPMQYFEPDGMGLYWLDL